VAVRSVSSLTVQRAGTRTYTFTGRVYPALDQRLVSLYRNGVLVAQGRTNGSGIYAITRTLAAGTFAFQVRTSNDQYNLGTVSPSGRPSSPSRARLSRGSVAHVRPLAGDQVDDAAGHGDGVVGEALVVAAGQRDVDGGSTPGSHVSSRIDREQLPVQLVHDVVVLLELRRHLMSRPAMTLPALATISSAAWPISQHVDAQRRRHRRRGVAAAGDLGDVHGVVAHPLEVGDHPQRGDDDAQVARDGLLAGSRSKARDSVSR
jgi:hypothetical protein